MTPQETLENIATMRDYKRQEPDNDTLEKIREINPLLHHYFWKIKRYEGWITEICREISNERITKEYQESDEEEKRRRNIIPQNPNIVRELMKDKDYAKEDRELRKRTQGRTLA